MWNDRRNDRLSAAQLNLLWKRLTKGCDLRFVKIERYCKSSESKAFDLNLVFKHSKNLCILFSNGFSIYFWPHIWQVTVTKLFTNRFYFTLLYFDPYKLTCWAHFQRQMVKYTSMLMPWNHIISLRHSGITKGPTDPAVTNWKNLTTVLAKPYHAFCPRSTLF